MNTQARHSDFRADEARDVARYCAWKQTRERGGARVFRSEWRSGALVSETVLPPRPNDPKSRRADYRAVKARHEALRSKTRRGSAPATHLVDPLLFVR